MSIESSTYKIAKTIGCFALYLITSSLLIWASYLLSRVIENRIIDALASLSICGFFFFLLYVIDKRSKNGFLTFLLIIYVLSSLFIHLIPLTIFVPIEEEKIPWILNFLLIIGNGILLYLMLIQAHKRKMSIMLYFIIIYNASTFFCHYLSLPLWYDYLFLK